MSPIDTVIYQHVRQAVIDGLERISRRIAAGAYLPRYSEFPKVSYFESGLPQFSKNSSLFGNTPYEYEAFLRDEYDPSNDPSWREFVALAQDHPRLRIHYNFDRVDSSKEDEPFSPWHMAVWHVQFTLRQLIDHYVHVTGSPRFEEARFEGLYSLWENCVFRDRLDFDIVVPIVCLTFDGDDFDFGDFAIARMSEELQLARSDKRTLAVAAHDTVAGAATHALVLRGWYIDNRGFFSTGALSNAEAFSDALKKVEAFFSALRIVTGADTGFAQVLARPDGWAEMWTAHLQYIYGFSLRAYPDKLENYGWLQSPPTIGRSDVDRIARLYVALTEGGHNRVRLAARRLSAAFLRQHEEDAILDVTIGLETLLADDSRNEITYRLALRLAALCAIAPFEGQKPSKVFLLAKKLYDFRSAVVHGSPKAEKKRLVALTPEQNIPAVALGTRLLRHALATLIDHPECLDMQVVDAELLDRTPQHGAIGSGPQDQTPLSADRAD